MTTYHPIPAAQRVRRRTFVLYWADHTPTVRVLVQSSGISWCQVVPGSLIGETTVYIPSAEDWHNLTFAMAKEQDRADRANEELLTEMQDYPEVIGQHIESLAGLVDASKCEGCGRWEVNLISGHCEPCEESNRDDYCNCRQPDCGDCGPANAHKPL